jgi:hypothetical protein
MNEYALTKWNSVFKSFGDRGKRLKLQQFLAKKADALYDKANLDKSVECIKQELGDEGNNALKYLIMLHIIR